MDPINDLTSETHKLSSKARRAFLEDHPVEAQKILCTLYNFLIDEMAGSPVIPHEPAEPSKE